MQDVRVSFAPLVNCMLPVDAGTDAGNGDAGQPDAGKLDGGPTGDGGADVTRLVWIGKESGGPGAPRGCGCSGVDAGLGGIAGLILLALRRRR